MKERATVWNIAQVPMTLQVGHTYSRSLCSCGGIRANTIRRDCAAWPSASSKVPRWSFAAQSGSVSSERRHNADFHAAKNAASSAVLPQDRFSQARLVFFVFFGGPVATETKPFGFDN